jgi:tetratricopeptide (TPR) repeat protein
VIWSERIDGPLSDSFGAQDRFALRTAAAVVPAVLQRELSRIAQQPPDRISAYDLTLQAAERTAGLRRDGFHQAPALLRQALARDAGWRPAHTQAAWWHATCVDQGWSADPQTEIAAALYHVQSALALDRDDPHALAVAGHLQGWFLRDPRKATGLLERALATGPACAWSWSLASLASACAGDGDTAWARGAEAVRLAPVGPDAGWHEYVVSLACHIQHRYEDAVHWGIKAADRDPDLAANLRCLTASLAAIGHWQEARRYADLLLAVDPTFRVGAFRARAPLAGDRSDHFAKRLCQAGLPA